MVNMIFSINYCFLRIWETVRGLALRYFFGYIKALRYLMLRKASSFGLNNFLRQLDPFFLGDVKQLCFSIQKSKCLFSPLNKYIRPHF